MISMGYKSEKKRFTGTVKCNDFNDLRPFRTVPVDSGIRSGTDINRSGEPFGTVGTVSFCGSTD
jgi:hypothetical protein